MRSGRDLLTRKHLWQAVPITPDATIFNPGMPKPRAEVLQAEDVCTPADRHTRSHVVELEHGPTRKRPAVFGPRWWRYGSDGALMSWPEPFQRISLGWSYDFGGRGCADNTSGKGPDAKDAIARGESAEFTIIESR